MIKQGAVFSDGKEKFSIAEIKDGIAEIHSDTGVDFLKIKAGESGYVATEIMDIFLQSDLKNFKQMN